jgi:competence protein ComEC
VRARPAAFSVAVASAALFSGFASAVIRTRGVETPILPRIAIAPLTGFVETIEERPNGARLVVRLHTLDKTPPERRPQRVRVTVRGRQRLAPGDFIAATGRLMPPPEAARPGGYDFARDAYYRGIGAVGSLVGRIEVRAPPAPPDLPLRLAAAVDEARNTLTRRIAQAIGGQAGAVAAALITGKRGLIDDNTNDILRAAGIYHIVSISGLHMVLAAGTFLWIARALLALFPGLALTWPIKKIAAFVGMFGAVAYCVFSGSDVATERSLFMILVMLGAILVDRPALSIRNLAISALIVLAREPETLLGPSLQMSYAAVAGLIAMAEWLSRRTRRREPGGLGYRLLVWASGAAAGTVTTTLVATLATGPFSAFHFQNLNPYGLIGNALTLPLVSVVVMPAAVLGVLAYPFGLDGPVWQLMGVACEGILRISAWVSALSGSTVIVPAFGAGALGLLVIALLAFTLLVSPLRWIAAAPALAGLWLAATPKRYDIFVDRDGAGAAVRNAEGHLVLIGRTLAFVAEQWLKADGDARKASDRSVRQGGRCDALGCTVVLPDGRAVALTFDRRAFAEDCRRAAIVISRLVAPAGCAAGLVVDRTFLDARGATAVRSTPSGLDVIAARRPDEARPWLRRTRDRDRAGERAAQAERTDGEPRAGSQDTSPDDFQ